MDEQALIKKKKKTNYTHKYVLLRSLFFFSMQKEKECDGASFKVGTVFFLSFLREKEVQKLALEKIFSCLHERKKVDSDLFVLVSSFLHPFFFLLQDRSLGKM